MNKHVPTRKTCQRLAEHVTLETEFYWWHCQQQDTGGAPVEGWEIGTDEPPQKAPSEEKDFPAPLLSELLAVMPHTVNDTGLMIGKDADYKYVAAYTDTKKKSILKTDHNPAEAAAQLLLWLLEQGHVTAQELTGNE